MRRAVAPITLVTLAGALGGAINAWLCYARVPVPVKDDPGFAWHLIPAGAVHGALLAGLAWSLGRTLAGKRLGLKLAAAFPLAWLAGFLSWIPLNRSAFDEPWARSLTWPFHNTSGAVLLAPLQYFGFVALLYLLAVSLCLVRDRRLVVHLALSAGAGTLGSLWWWIEMQPWYFSVIHGSVWGVLVGIASWTRVGDE